MADEICPSKDGGLNLANGKSIVLFVIVSYSQLAAEDGVDF
jgi:hypothetical protein